MLGRTGDHKFNQRNRNQRKRKTRTSTFYLLSHFDTNSYLDLTLHLNLTIPTRSKVIFHFVL